MNRIRALLPWAIGLIFIFITQNWAWAGDMHYLPSNEELPLGYKLVEKTRIRHPWFSEPVTMGEWQLEQNQGEDSRIVIYIGSRQGEFDRRMEELAQKADIKPGFIDLGAGEEKAIGNYLRGDYNIYFTKNSYGVIVEAVGTDDLLLKKLTSEQGVNIIIKSLAQGIAMNLSSETQNGLEKTEKNFYPVGWAAIILLLIIVLIMVKRLQISR